MNELGGPASGPVSPRGGGRGTRLLVKVFVVLVAVAGVVWVPLERFYSSVHAAANQENAQVGQALASLSPVSSELDQAGAAAGGVYSRLAGCPTITAALRLPASALDSGSDQRVSVEQTSGSATGAVTDDRVNCRWNIDGVGYSSTIREQSDGVLVADFYYQDTVPADGAGTNSVGAPTTYATVSGIGDDAEIGVYAPFHGQPAGAELFLVDGNDDLDVTADNSADAESFGRQLIAALGATG